AEFGPLAGRSMNHAPTCEEWQRIGPAAAWLSFPTSNMTSQQGPKQVHQSFGNGSRDFMPRRRIVEHWHAECSAAAVRGTMQSRMSAFALEGAKAFPSHTPRRGAVRAGAAQLFAANSARSWARGQTHRVSVCDVVRRAYEAVGLC